MKKYNKPEIRFMDTQIAERIAGNCFGTNSTFNKVTVTFGGITYIVQETTIGSWGVCGDSSYYVTNGLQAAINAAFPGDVPFFFDAYQEGHFSSNSNSQAYEGWLIRPYNS